ncbi:MAG: trigger factor [Dehalococcoidia bacterium]
MKVSTETLENCQAILTIEAEANELDRSLEEAYRHMVREVSVPGFRRGKAPRAVLVQHVGKASLFEEALEHLVPQLYKQAIESQKIDPIAAPEIEIIQREPLVFKATVALKPEVKLGDYHSLRLEPSAQVEVTEQEVGAALAAVRERQGAWVPVERSVELGDLITMDIEADVEGRPWLKHKGILYEVDKDSRSPVPGFASCLTGIRKNEQKTFSLAIPDDYPIEGMRGKESTFTAIVTEIKQKQLPELDDQLARSLGYDSLSDMEAKFVADLRAQAEARNRLESELKALDALVEISEVNYPPILEEEEIARLLRDEAQRWGFKEVSDYLKKTRKTEEELRQEVRPVARKGLIRNLVLEKLAEQENIEITPSEVDNRANEIIGNAEDKQRARQFLSLPNVRQSMEQSLRTQKAMDRLLEIAMANIENEAKGG